MTQRVVMFLLVLAALGVAGCRDRHRPPRRDYVNDPRPPVEVYDPRLN